MLRTLLRRSCPKRQSLQLLNRNSLKTISYSKTAFSPTGEIRQQPKQEELQQSRLHHGSVYFRVGALMH